jgi:catechol-2,3-dioxygenase
VLRVGSIVVRVDDLERPAEFWQDALGYERGIEREDFVLLRPRDGPLLHGRHHALEGGD